MKIIETTPKTNNMSKDTWIHLYKRFNELGNPQLSALKDFLEAPFQMVFDDTEPYQQKSYELFMQALCLKKDGMTTEPSPIESTMTRVQLFLCNSPLWTIGLQPNAIKTILVEYNKVKRFNKPELIEYCGQLLARNKKRHWEFVCDLINTRTDLKWVKEFLDAKVPKAVDKGKLHAIRIYYTTRTLEPTMIEKTMSPEQLFQVHSPFWATGLTITHIQNILEVYPQVELTAFFEYFDQLLDEEQHWVTSHMLYKRYRKGTE